MLSDGALRMLVLLHFHQNGFSPLQLAYLFLFYELAGIFTNPSAGWLAARYGLKLTLYAGAGLVDGSIPEQEKRVTDWKLQAMLEVITGRTTLP